jgi:hypothetical protein
MAKSQKQTGLTRRPIVFYRNSTCPEYSLGETNFIVENVFTPAAARKIHERAALQAAYTNETSIPEVYRLSPSYYYRDQIARCWIVRESRARYTSEVGKYVVQAVKQFGVDALKLNGFDKYRLDPDPNIMNEKMAKSDAFSRVIEPYIRSAAHEKQNLSNKLTPEVLKAAREAADRVSIPKKLRLKKRDLLQYMNPLGRAREEAELFELRYRDSLGSVICEVLRQWRKEAEEGTIDERRNAVKSLRQFGEALIPDTRGKRRKILTASTYEVKKFYLRELYRLYHVDNALHSKNGLRNHNLKVKQASENYNFPVDLIREFWGLDEENRPDRRPLKVKDMARELTARHFKITHPRVSNIIRS